MHSLKCSNATCRIERIVNLNQGRWLCKGCGHCPRNRTGQTSPGVCQRCASREWTPMMALVNLPQEERPDCPACKTGRIWVA